ncbi:hypothetical protein J2128_001473 [Methanomicrobium sp. W14]|uniref:hypothetical protein n=1 Tax=Methanomicrobium sp. W14 TaxID=2817839 RepID=UPI001AE13B18|nr:hypothetical protein [Methanomicrobium sp. W14]MBP2133519.1 hypothetical protein [Methanomicrobium sp. W14]
MIKKRKNGKYSTQGVCSPAKAAYGMEKMQRTGMTATPYYVKSAFEAEKRFFLPHVKRSVRLWAFGSRNASLGHSLQTVLNADLNIPQHTANY